jgi:hypothetical protein
VRIALAIVLCCLGPACKKKAPEPAAPSCAAAFAGIEKLKLDELLAQPDDPPELKALQRELIVSARKVVTESCEDDRWTGAVRTCLVDARDVNAVSRCLHELSKEQLDNMTVAMSRLNVDEDLIAHMRAEQERDRAATAAAPAATTAEAPEVEGVHLDWSGAIDDGKHERWPVEEGRYRLTISTEQDALAVKWLGPDCGTATQLRSFSTECRVTQPGELFVENPTGGSSTDAVHATLRLTRLR